MRYFVTLDGEEHRVDVTQLASGGYEVKLVQNGSSAPLGADVVSLSNVLSVRLDGQVFDVVVDGEMPDLDIYASGRRASVSVESSRTRAAGQIRGKKSTKGPGAVTSPMPGRVVKVLVAEGDTVEPGTPLVVVEAMKMENELAAESAGVVKKVSVAPGDAVEGGALLVTVG